MSVEFLPIELSEMDIQFHQFSYWAAEIILQSLAVPLSQMSPDGYGQSDMDRIQPIITTYLFAKQFNEQYFRDTAPQIPEWIKEYRATEQRRLTA